MRPSKIILPVVLILGCIVLAACNFPIPDQPTQNERELELTRAAQTVSAQLTQQAIENLLTRTPTDTNGNDEPGRTPTPGEDPTPGDGTPTPVDCDRVRFVADVTYPDNVRVDLGDVFQKTWKLQNIGSCTWTSGYSIVFVRGDAMGAPASVPLTDSNIAPNENVEVSVTLTAPEVSGTYQGHWMLRNPAGQIFGLGAQKEGTFWVKVRVAPPPGISYDFIARSPFVQWIASGDGSQYILPFGGPEDNPDGVAMLKQNFRLEDGSMKDIALLTAPRQTADGKISGVFESYTVEDGDYFRATLGFKENCSVGKVVFQLQYQEGNNTYTMAEWKKTCDGTPINVERNLISLKGKTVQFVLTVLADGSVDEDLAAWVSARIER